jgi:hypothetical protein
MGLTMNKSRVATMLFVAVMMAGCGMIARREAEERRVAIRTEAQAAIQVCREQYPEGAKPMARARCFNSAEEIMRPLFPYPDLLDLRMATRTSLAEKEEHGQLTHNDAVLQFAQFHSQNVAEEQRRLNSNRSTAAQELAADSAGDKSVTCNRFGNTVSCY